VDKFSVGVEKLQANIFSWQWLKKLLFMAYVDFKKIDSCSNCLELKRSLTYLTFLHI